MSLKVGDPLFELPLWMDRYSFVAWRRPGENNYESFIAEVKVLSDASLPDKKAFIFSPFNSEGIYPVLAFYPIEDKELKNPTSEDVTFSMLSPDNIPDNNLTYFNRIEQLIEKINEGSLKKCVLSRRIDLEEPMESTAPELFLQLCNDYPQAFVSLVHIPGVFTWLGASPELLLEVKDQKAHTTALAATRPFSEQKEAATFPFNCVLPDKSSSEVDQKEAAIHQFNAILPDITEWNEKEKEEQKLVSDYIINVLNNAGIKKIKSIGPHSVQAGKLIHLKTDFHFSITPKSDIPSLLKDLHPTPAVCGLPKEEALKMINDLEPHDREYYSGYLGLVNKNVLELYVNLRCMRWLRGKPSLFVGGGITAASAPQQEWEETNYKSHTMLDVIEKLCNLAGKKPDAH